jgi:hypothetical protein
MLFVRGLDGRHLTVRVDLDETVDQVMDQVESKTGIPAKAQTFLYGRNVLESSKPLRYYNIQREATLTLKASLKSVVNNTEY